MVAQGRIVRVTETLPRADLLDLGNVALVPGLINAHTHLEFSGLTEPLGTPGGGMASWIRDVIAYRRQAPRTPISVVIRAGLAQSLAQGVTTLGEIAQFGWPVDVVAAANLDTSVFLELIGSTSSRVDEAINHAQAHLCKATPSRSWRPGLSPHSPYSVHPSLFREAISLSREHGIPLAFHLAESADEMELFESGGGPLRGLLEELGAWQDGIIEPGSRPLDYLRSLTEAHRTLIIHGNYLDEEEIGLLAQHRSRMSVVYCPRTHARFGHRPYPLQEMLDAGVRVALGTDSRASSPDLSLLAEMRHVARGFPQMGGDRVLQMGTIAGAEALGLGPEVGSLEPGKWADLVAVELPDRNVDDPHELLLRADGLVSGVWRRGVRQVTVACRDTE